MNRVGGKGGLGAFYGKHMVLQEWSINLLICHIDDLIWLTSHGPWILDHLYYMLTVFNEITPESK